MSTSQQAKPKYCQSFHPGHNVHWIHSRHEFGSLRNAASGIVIHNGWVHFTANGRPYSRWTHNADVIRNLLVSRPDAVVEVSPSWSILYVETSRPSKLNGGSAAMFNLSIEPSDCMGGLAFGLDELPATPAQTIS